MAKKFAINDIPDAVAARVISSYEPERDAEGEITKSAKQVALDDMRQTCFNHIRTRCKMAIDNAKVASDVATDIGDLVIEERALSSIEITVTDDTP